MYIRDRGVDGGDIGRIPLYNGGWAIRQMIVLYRFYAAHRHYILSRVRKTPIYRRHQHGEKSARVTAPHDERK